jgi:hypothetical protein
VAFAGARLAGKQHIFFFIDKAQRHERFDEAALELGLKVEVEGLECFSNLQAGVFDASVNRALLFSTRRFAEQTLGKLEVGNFFGFSPGKESIELRVELS